MSTATQTPARIEEIWTVSTKRGIRYYYVPRRELRSFPMPKAKAELLLVTGGAVLVQKPWFLA